MEGGRKSQDESSSTPGEYAIASVLGVSQPRAHDILAATPVAPEDGRTVNGYSAVHLFLALASSYDVHGHGNLTPTVEMLSAVTVQEQETALWLHCHLHGAQMIIHQAGAIGHYVAARAAPAAEGGLLGMQNFFIRDNLVLGGAEVRDALP